MSLVFACKFDRLLLAQSFWCFGVSKKSRRVQKLAFVEYLFLGKIQVVLSGSQKWISGIKQRAAISHGRGFGHHVEHGSTDAFMGLPQIFPGD